MHTDSSTSKTDGICAFASFYMSLCCRSELFLNSGELNPCCPDCQRPTEWIIVLRCGYSIDAQTRRVELRRTRRYTLPKEGLCVVCVEWNFSRVEDVRVLNVSHTGSHVPFQLLVVRPVHDPHSAGANLFPNRVLAKPGSDHRPPHL